MRGGHLIPLYAVVAFIFLSILYYSSHTWRRVLDRRVLTGIKIRQLNAIANNLTKIIMATETESAMLNQDINKFLKIIEKQVEFMKQRNLSKTL